MTVARKILFSFLLSAVIFAVVAIIAASSVFVVLVAVFLTLFLTIFFCFNLRQDSPAVLYEVEELEELEVVEDAPLMDTVPEPPPISASPVKTSNIRLAFGDDDIPYLVESSGLELIDGDIDEAIRFLRYSPLAEPAEIEELESVSSLLVSEETAELEDISAKPAGSIFTQLFAFSLYNPELLQDAGSEVIYEQDGIHYISSDVIRGENAAAELNIDFAQLVESVVNK